MSRLLEARAQQHMALCGFSGFFVPPVHIQICRSIVLTAPTKTTTIYPDSASLSTLEVTDSS